MLQNLEKTRAMVRNFISRASTILAEECQLTLPEEDFLAIQRKMDKINQRLDELYKNWQAEYRDAAMSEDCKEIRKFYKPYLEKCESKYRILYHLLEQANKSGQTSMFSTQEPISGIIPSLAALDDAQALRWKEWIRGEPGEDMSQQYCSISGHLTLTSPRHEDMRLDSTLNVTPEGSLGNLSTAVGGIEEDREREHQTPEERLQEGPSTDVKTSIKGTPETFLKVVPERNIRESPRRIQRTREASREDAITLTRQFFATVSERNRCTTMEEPIETLPDVHGGNEDDVPVTSIPAATTTPVATEAETTETETRRPRAFLPNGSPSRPTATATYRPRTWVQCISDGQVNEPTQEDTNSGESYSAESYVLAEGIPEELGCEWRVLHPFEIPGVRFLTDNTPPNQRRLAENDALVEVTP